MSDSAQLIDALGGLADALNSTGLRLDIGTAVAARAARDELAHQIGDYVIPRLRRLDAPLLVVLGGSTGSGKSTITNTLVGYAVSPAGVLRPTTRSPVLICHPDDRPWFSGDDVLPDLPRVTGDDSNRSPIAVDDAGVERDPLPAGGPVLRIVTSEGLPAGLAIIDAPDIDSVEEANRDLATQLLSAADMWLFTTTAMRYADAVPWDFLRQARDRGTSLAIIINRIPAGSGAEIVPHFGSMLTEAGLDGVDVHPVAESELHDGLLSDEAVADIRDLLVGLAGDAERRAEVVRTTLGGAMDSIGSRARAVVAAARHQDGAVEELRAAADRLYLGAGDQLAADIGSGNLLRGEVLDRWQELIGTA